MRFLSAFRRVTSSGAFIAEIDGLRFIAIGVVVLFHLCVGLALKAPAAFTRPAEGNLLSLLAFPGFHGVELFFIISGYILAYPFASHHLLGKPAVGLRQYFLRRVTRLEPPYMLCMILFFFVVVFLKSKSAHEMIPHLLASLAYLHNVIYRAESPINNVAWSLEIEIQFYILVPLLSKIFAVRNTALRRSVIALMAFGSILVCSRLTPDHVLYLTIARFLHFFLLGFMLADVYLVTWKGRPTRSWYWDLVTLLLWPVLIVTWNGEHFLPQSPSMALGGWLSQLLFSVLAFTLYCAVFRGVLTNRFFTNV
jgi:peptidoglycan/LPS O-acetylase OafA/YrhL